MSAPTPSKPIRCLAIDMDGTLLTSSGNVTARTGSVLQRARDAGVLPIIVTGKIPGPWQEVVRRLKLNAPMVCPINGAATL